LAKHSVKQRKTMAIKGVKFPLCPPPGSATGPRGHPPYICHWLYVYGIPNTDEYFWLDSTLIGLSSVDNLYILNCSLLYIIKIPSRAADLTNYTSHYLRREAVYIFNWCVKEYCKKKI